MDKKSMPGSSKVGDKNVSDKPRIGENEPGPSGSSHLGSSDAFLQTENTGSPDADNISDEKLDELLDED